MLGQKTAGHLPVFIVTKGLDTQQKQTQRYFKLGMGKETTVEAQMEMLDSASVYLWLEFHSIPKENGRFNRANSTEIWGCFSSHAQIGPFY